MDILIIDDHPGSARAMQMTVERMVPPGFDVRFITNARLGSFASVLDPDLKALILDYLMPHMDGEKVTEEVLRVRPRMRGRIIICTGYDSFEPEVEKHLFVDLACRKLPKPVDLAVLKKMIDEILAMPD